MSKLIQDCLTELKNNEEARERFNKFNQELSVKIVTLPYTTNNLYSSTGDAKNPVIFYQLRFNDGEYDAGERDLLDNDCAFTDEQTRIYIIQTLLSRVEGKAVMEFLDVKVQASYSIDLLGRRNPFWFDRLINYYQPKTLDHLLYREFTEALRVGKPLEEALEIINKIYIENI